MHAKDKLLIRIETRVLCFPIEDNSILPGIDSTDTHTHTHTRRVLSRRAEIERPVRVSTVSALGI